jgi:hypothetical protein
VTAPEKVHLGVSVHAGSDLTISDADLHWREIHRVKSFVPVSNGYTYYRTDCGRYFLLRTDARPLSSGWLGAGCSSCWRHLPHEAVAA